MERVPITPDGIAKLREELKQLRDVERPRISKAIGEAIAMGDLSENAEYHAAKERPVSYTHLTLPTIYSV